MNWGSLFGDEAEVFTSTTTSTATSITTSTEATTVGGRGLTTETTTEDSFFDDFESEEVSIDNRKNLVTSIVDINDFDCY